MMAAAAHPPTPAPIAKLRERVEAINRRRAEDEAAAPAGGTPLVIHHQVRIKGELLEHAVVRTEPGTCRAIVQVVVQQCFGSLPVIATRRFDDSPSSHVAAHSLAKRLRAGTEVQVEGQGMRLHHHKREAALQVLKVTAVYPQLQSVAPRKDLE
jgi:hypothetical protein